MNVISLRYICEKAREGIKVSRIKGERERERERSERRDGRVTRYSGAIYEIGVKSGCQPGIIEGHRLKTVTGHGHVTVTAYTDICI